MPEDQLKELVETLKEFIRDEIRKAMKKPAIDMKELWESDSQNEY